MCAELYSLHRVLFKPLCRWAESLSTVSPKNTKETEPGGPGVEDSAQLPDMDLHFWLTHSSEMPSMSPQMGAPKSVSMVGSHLDPLQSPRSAPTTPKGIWTITNVQRRADSKKELADWR